MPPYVGWSPHGSSHEPSGDGIMHEVERVTVRIAPRREATRKCQRLVRVPSEDHLPELEDGRTVGYATWGHPQGTPVFIGHGIPGSRLDHCVALDDPEWVHMRRVRFMPRGMRAALSAESFPATPPGRRSLRSPCRRLSALVRSATRSSLSSRRAAAEPPRSPRARPAPACRCARRQARWPGHRPRRSFWRFR
jgi:hypothetical protein